MSNTFTIKNKELSKTIDFFYEMPLKGKESRHRMRVVKLLKEKLETLANEELDLIKEYTGVDENGNPKVTEDGVFDIPDVSDVIEFKKEQEMLLEEECIVSMDKITIDTIREILADYDGELSGEKAELHSYLCDIFKVD